MSVTAKNPIMSGFYPDPSMCAVGEDFYLVNSTFAYFPGLPVLHSRDLAHWEQIGNVLDRESQLPLEKAGHSQGLFAPTIRYHEGVFYVICTNVSHGGNFIVTAENPAGPWSEPHYLEGAGGIDPSLFFDEDGTCYYIGTHPNPAGCAYDGDWYIWIQELDLKQMKLVGEPKDVWNGALKNCIWPEGPHLYKKDGYYYIMHAEGGTGPDHAVMVCRSRNLWGPYVNNPCNPILTHRHLGREYPIRYVGHADLVQTVMGDWYMGMLAVRPTQGYTTMGRETFLAKVTWENDWPVVNAGEGKLTDTVKVELPEWKPQRDVETPQMYDFTSMKELTQEFLFLRNPKADMYRLEEGKGLFLRYQDCTLKEQASPSYIAARQRHHNFLAMAALQTESLSEGNYAGLALMQSNLYHLRVEATKGKVFAILCEKGVDKIIGEMPVRDGQLVLCIQVRGLEAEINVTDETGARKLAEGVDIRCLSTEVAGGFVGCTVGMYAVSESENVLPGEACFTHFSYQA